MIMIKDLRHGFLLKSLNEVNDDNQLKVIDETFTKMTKMKLQRQKVYESRLLDLEVGCHMMNWLITVHLVDMQKEN